MLVPNLSNSHIRLFLSKTTRPARILMVILAVAVAAMALGSRSSSAGTFGQVLLAKAAAMIGAGAASTTAHALDAHVAEEEQAQSSSMATERRGHTATRLQDGRVLIAGGENSTGALNGTEIFDPATDTFSAAGNMDAARADHSATLLADGRVLIAGGRNSAGSLATTEIFDPATGTFSSGASMSVARAGHSATLFADGRIFIAGGDGNGSAELMTASLSESSLVGAMSGARAMHSAALMLDGRVLIVGGRDGNGDPLATGEIFGTGFSTIETTLKLARVRPHLRVLFDGKVQIIGGNNDRSMEIYDPAAAIFGAYAHVLPESDPCTGLHNQVLGSQTRAALFHSGATDELFDRSGHTITELGGEALVLGGANGAGAFLGSSSVVASSSAAISTDKMDYAPGETAIITGRGYQAGEVVRLKIHEDPHTPQERGFDVTADGDGNFSGEYLVMDYDLNMKFIVGARGLTSGRTAQTTFTDANPQLITVAAPTSATVTQGGTAIYGNVTVQVGGNTNPCTVTLGVTPALPAGAAAVFGTNPNTTTGGNIVTSLSVTTSASTPAGTYTFQVTGSNGPGCQGPGPTPSATVTLIVNSATVNTTTTVANATATYGDSSVTLNATVTPDSGPAVNSGSVTFTVKQGATTIGVATADNTIVAGAASVSYGLPAGTAAGPYTIEASYSGATGFNASAGTGTLTIDKKGLTITASDKSKTYGDTVVFDETTPSTDFSVVGLINTDTVASITLTSAGAAATATVAGSPYAIVPSAAVGTGLENYDISYVNGSLTVDPKPLTITASNKTKTYGDTVVFDETTPSTDFTVAGLINGDTVASITLTSAGALATAPVSGSPYSIVPSAAVGSGLTNYAISYVNGTLTVNKASLTITASSHTITFNDPVPTITASYTGFVAGDDANDLTVQPTCSTTYTVGSLIGAYPTKCENAASGNYNITYVDGTVTVLTACSAFNGFLAPIGGNVESGTGGSFASPVRSFKLNSTIPVKFNAVCFGVPLTTGIHTLQAIKYSSSTTADDPIDATPTDSATTGNQFRLTGTEWHFNLSTKGLGNNGQGTWLLRATLFDGSTYSVWVSVKK